MLGIEYRPRSTNSIAVRHIIDEREFECTAEFFTVTPSLDHQATNVVMTEPASGVVRVLSKGIGVLAGGTVGSVTHRGIVVRSPDGWRIAKRVASKTPPTS